MTDCIDKRESILRAARSVFVKAGFSGASMSQIASKSGVNHSLIFHYFGSKQKLWQVVKDTILDEGKAVYSNLPSSDKPLEDFLCELIKRAAVFYKKNPDIVRMLGWQRLESTSTEATGLSFSKDIENWISICKEYQNKGEINKSYKPEYLVILTLSVVNSIAMDQNIFTREYQEEYIKFCAHMLCKSFL